MARLKNVKGSFSTDVREPRTATGSRMFTFLASFCSLPWTGKALIIWQSSVKVNPHVLIGPFLVGILPYGHGNGHKPCIFFMTSGKFENLLLKLRK